ncbi:MAG TPA: hypothetical protein VIT65_10190 [Microlunatus sp.]
MLFRTGAVTRLVCTCGAPLGELRSENGMVPVIDRMYRHREKLRERERLTRCAR